MIYVLPRVQDGFLAVTLLSPLPFVFVLISMYVADLLPTIRRGGIYAVYILLLLLGFSEYPLLDGLKE